MRRPEGHDGAVELEELLRRMRIAPKGYRELFEVALRRADRVDVRSRRGLERVKRRECSRIDAAASYVVSVLKGISLSSPFLRDLHPFHRELVSTMMDVDEYRKGMAMIYGAARIISRVASEHKRMVRMARDAGEAARARRAFFGRLRSILEDLDEYLGTVRGYQLELLKLPSINPYMDTIIIAGPPNVGKSSLLRAVTRAKPEVREYPFTTKNVVVGHMEVKGRTVQVVDTPGLLDRPLGERNRVELRAIAALRHLRGVVVFMFDPTETCGFPLDYQVRVYRDVADLLSGVPRVLVSNKVDITGPAMASRLLERLGDERREVLFISALRGTNVDHLVEEAVSRLGG